MTEDNKVQPSGHEPTMEEMERLHNAVMAIELQLQDIGTHHPKLLGQALLSMATFMVEKIYHCSANIESANLLLASANEAGLQSWIDIVEAQRTTEAEPKIILDS